GAHGDPNPFGQFPPPGDFDGVNGTLAHTLGGPPPNIFGTLAGDIHFDDDETWINAVRGDGSQPIDLVTVAAHEIGHAIGLDHTTVSGALMLENYTSSHRFLGTDDILGIQSLYGASSNDFITGPSIICTSGNMSITDLPSYAGATVSWSSSNIGVLTINSSSGVATRVGLNSGSVVITATITTACGSTSITKNVHVGLPTNVYGLLDGQPVSYPQYCNTASRLAVFGSGIQTYNWAVTDGSIALTPLIDHPHMADIGFFSDYVRIRARVSNTCGNSDFIYYLLDPTMWFMAYPNPATNELTIQFSDISDAELLPKAVYLYHESSTIPKKQANVKEVYDKNGLLEGNKLIWDVSSLPRGTYYLHVVPSEKSDKKGIEKLRIILE